jgi:hypothetical protein
MKKQLILSSVFFLMLSVIACKKGEQGDIGPAGVAGAKGAKGTTGDNGIADSKGMISSDWIAVKGTDWRLSTAIPNLHFVTFTAPGLTTDIVNKGMIYVYMKTEGFEGTYALPRADVSTGRRFYAIVGLANSGAPAVQFYQSVTPPSSTFSTSTNVSFRYVAVPAGARTSNIDWTNYEEVKKVLNWKD